MKDLTTLLTYHESDPTQTQEAVMASRRIVKLIVTDLLAPLFEQWETATDERRWSLEAAQCKVEYLENEEADERTLDMAMDSLNYREDGFRSAEEAFELMQSLIAQGERFADLLHRYEQHVARDLKMWD